LSEPAAAVSAALPAALPAEDRPAQRSVLTMPPITCTVCPGDSRGCRAGFYRHRPIRLGTSVSRMRARQTTLSRPPIRAGSRQASWSSTPGGAPSPSGRSAVTGDASEGFVVARPLFRGELRRAAAGPQRDAALRFLQRRAATAANAPHRGGIDAGQLAGSQNAQAGMVRAGDRPWKN